MRSLARFSSPWLSCVSAVRVSGGAPSASSASTSLSSSYCIAEGSSTLPGWSAGAAGVLRLTRPLLREHKRLSAAELIEAHNESKEQRASLIGSSTLELNLLEDPTAGLASGPAEELSPTELETRVRVLVSSYTPSLYRLLYTPFIDVVWLLVQEKLVPEAGNAEQTTTTTTTNAAAAGTADGMTGAAAPSATQDGGATVSTSSRPVRPEEIMSRWFTDGASTLKHPHETAEAMGKRRWAHLCRALEAHWADMEAVMPLTSVVRRHGLREDLYVPLLRQLAMELADPTKRAAAVATLPGFILSLANGRAPRSLGLPERDEDRIQLVSNLFLGVAQEAGDTDLAYLALQLLRANNMETPFAAQKKLTNVFAAASRMETDWRMRGSSLLVECYRSWLDYYRTVQQDNVAALEKLEAAIADADAGSVKHHRDAAVTAEAEAADSNEHYRYFTSRRQDDIIRITALEKNITEAVLGRASELRRLPTRRRWRRKSAAATGAPGEADDVRLVAAEPSAAAAATAPPRRPKGTKSAHDAANDGGEREAKVVGAAAGVEDTAVIARPSPPLARNATDRDRSEPTGKAPKKTKAGGKDNTKKTPEVGKKDAETILNF